MLTRGVLYYEFYLHPIWTSQSSSYGVWTFSQPVDHTNSPLFWIQAFLVVERACITLLQSERVLLEGFSFMLKIRRGIWCTWLSANSKHFETLDVEIIISIRLYIFYVQFLNLDCVLRWSYSPVVTGWFESDTAAEMSFLGQTQCGESMVFPATNNTFIQLSRCYSFCSKDSPRMEKQHGSEGRKSIKITTKTSLM